MDCVERTVDDLIQGSKNIDRMKQEIWFVVQMITGLISRETINLDEHFLGGRGLFLYSPNRSGCCWLIQPDKYGSPLVNLSVSCMFQQSTVCCGGSFSVERIGVWSKTKQPFFSSVKIVKHVYDQLPVFVNGMAEKFPEVASGLEPFLAVSKMKFY